MRIGIYIETAMDERPTGIGLHVRHLLQGLARIEQKNEYLLYYSRPMWGKDRPIPHGPREANFRARPVRIPVGWPTSHPTFWWKWWLPLVLRRDRIDIFHGPNHFLPAWDRDRSVVTIHDLAYFKMSVHQERGDEYMKVWTRFSLDQAGAVIALSENTRRDIEAQGVEAERIRVIYGGGNIVPEEQIQYARVEEMRRSLKLPEKYILFVGTLQPRKNVPFLLRAYAELKKRGQVRHGLVLAGHRDTAAAEIDQLISELGLSDDVVITGYVEAWHLPLLYKQADLFVLPTLYEGFTLVTLEAMAYGTPLIATDTSSIREGVGDAGLLVPVNDTAALARAMHDVLTDKSLRQGLIARGHVQARKFTWEQCARDTLALYQEMSERSQRGRLGVRPPP